MSKTKGLNLDRTKIEATLLEVAKKFLGDDVSVTPNPKTRTTIFSIKNKTQELKINLYENTDGTTTLTPNEGPHKDIGILIVENVIPKILIDERKNFSLLIQKFTQEQRTILFDLLKEDDDATISKATSADTYEMYTVTGKHNDTVTIKHYTNTNIQFQGKPIFLYKKITYILSELCDSKEIIKLQEDFHDIKINQDSLDYDYITTFTEAASFLGEDLRNIILPSFTLQKINIELPDYSMFLFPILRGLEGYIKKIFSLNEILIGNNNIGGHFKPQLEQYVLDIDTMKKITCDRTRTALGIIYTAIHKERNSLFHTDSFESMTRTVDTIEEAQKIFYTLTEIIESSYVTYLKGNCLYE